VIYEPGLFALLALRSDISAVIKNDGAALFTGVCNADLSWEDGGAPLPVKKISLTVRDNTYKLNRKTAAELALINTAVAAAVQKLCQDCGVAVSSGTALPQTEVRAFVIDKNASYLAVLDALLFQYGYSFYFDAAGHLALFDFSAAPPSPPVLDQGAILAGASVTRQNKAYTAVRITYNPIVEKKNELVYFSGGGYNSDGSPAPVVLQPGVYYPFDAAPAIEASEGQVYQDFAAGCAETVRKYNGEADFRRSQKTTLLYTQNHAVAEDWDPGIVIDRAGFTARQASVRVRNAGQSDANLYQLSIRADAWYRAADASAVSGSGAEEYTFAAEYIYAGEPAARLSGILYRYFTGKKYKITVKSETYIPPGTFKTIDTGISGFTAPALAFQASYDAETELFAVSWLATGDAAVDTSRYKNASYDPAAGAEYAGSLANTRLDKLADGSSPDVGRPDNVTGLMARAGKDTVHITWNPLGDGLANALKYVRIEIKKTAGGPWQTFETRGSDFVYNFDRSSDGYPEASGLAAWRVRVKAANIYGRESVEYAPDAGGLPVDASSYGTWLPAPPALTAVSSGRTVSLEAPLQTWYGAAGCEYQISKPVAGTPWYAPAMADTGTVYSNEDSWKGAEGGAYPAGTRITQQLPLEGQAASAPRENTAYKYRARSLTRAYDGSVLYRGAWGAEAAAIAKGAGVRDVVEGAVGTAQLQQKAVQALNIGDAAADITKMASGVRPTRTIAALPSLTDASYQTGDTVVLTADDKVYRRTSAARQNPLTALIY
jgi:hypothetical protein